MGLSFNNLFSFVFKFVKKILCLLKIGRLFIIGHSIRQSNVVSQWGCPVIRRILSSDTDIRIRRWHISHYISGCRIDRLHQNDITAEDEKDDNLQLLTNLWKL